MTGTQRIRGGVLVMACVSTLGGLGIYVLDGPMLFVYPTLALLVLERVLAFGEELS